MRIATLTSGGDCPGLNAVIRAVVEKCAAHGTEVYGFRGGWRGALTGEGDWLTLDDVENLQAQGGTLLFTSRTNVLQEENGPERVRATMEKLGLNGIVAIGGDGTFRGALALSRQAADRGHQLQVVGIPATIDNDIGCSHYTIGFDTACNTAVECIDKLRDTMQSHERCSVVEVMGRHAGHLALYVGLGVGATAVLIPEREVDFQRDIVEKIRQARLAGTTHYMVVVAEGAGSAADIGRRIHEELGLDPRVTVLGHIQRGGTPTCKDRVYASIMGAKAAELLAAGKSNRLVAYKHGEFVDFDIQEALNMKKDISEEQFNIAKMLVR